MSGDELAGYFDSNEVEDIRRTIIDAVEDWANNRPRNLQKRIGPSGAGVECDRRLAYAVSNEQIPDSLRVSQRGDVLPSVSGTALHGVMEEVMARVNQKLGRERYLIESKVLEPIAGTCDLFDIDTGSVVDYKWLGATSFPKMTKNGPVPEYRKQVLLYGLGMENLGYTVRRVAIFAGPRAGRLRDAHLWAMDYDREEALAAARRVEQMEGVVEILEAVANPYRFQLIPAKPSPAACQFCPHFTSDKNQAGNPFACPGYLDPDAANLRVNQLQQKEIEP